MEKSWDIIVWSKENVIDYVPSSWGNETKTKYKYPTSTNSFKIKKSIDTCMPINENFHWLEAICKAKAVKDLSMANDLCKKGQYTSNLETADEQTVTENKRIRKKKKRLYESNASSEESTDDEPLSDLINSRKKNKLNKQIDAYAGGGLIREKFNEEINIATPASTGRATSRTALCNISSNNEELVSPFRNSAQRAENNNGLASSNDFTTVVSEIYNIKFEIQEIRKVVDRLENIITVNAVANISNEEPAKMNSKLPCETTVDIDYFEAEMEDQKNFKNLVSILYLLGGNTPHKTVYFIMNKLFGKQLALKYSGQGKKKKIPFCGLKIYDAIMVATRKRHPSSTEDEIRKSVALFLATAKSRLPKDRPERNNSQDRELDQETDD